MTTVKKESIPEPEKKEKISDLISSYKRAYELEHKEKRIPVSFYKGDIKHVFERKSDKRKVAIIAFPKDSKYYGYVFFYPADWIYKSEKIKPGFSENPDRRFIYIPVDYKTDIIKSEKDDSGKFETKDSHKLSASELKEGMKRKRRGK